MSESKAQDDIDKEAFEQWKSRWNKEYLTSKEETIRFEKFKENLRLEEANSGNSGPSEPPWMALDTHADGIPFEQYKVEILGLEPDNPEERVVSDSDSEERIVSDSDSEEREIFMKGYGKAHYGVKDKDGKFQLKFIYTKNLRDTSDKDSWYVPPVDNGQYSELMTSYTKNLKGPFPWCVPPVDKGQSDHEMDDTKEEEEHVTAKRQSGRKKDDTKHVFSDSDTSTDSEGRELKAMGYSKVCLRVQDEDGTFRMDTFYSKNPTHPISDVGARYYKGQSGRKKDDTKHVTAKRQSDHENDDTKEVKRHKSGCGGGEDAAAMTVEPEPENEVVP
ncbi:putative cathepsin propeptide inhibitor domain (I29), papain-like cysteine peptidase superfamily [Helianthus annuus]|nr:putative cathepsin propeptide inhibitor domain (I29), papain-like cysteine peptidase superfamily [Helianthus annuus]